MADKEEKKIWRVIGKHLSHAELRTIIDNMEVDSRISARVLGEKLGVDYTYIHRIWAHTTKLSDKHLKIIIKNRPAKTLTKAHLANKSGISTTTVQKVWDKAKTGATAPADHLKTKLTGHEEDVLDSLLREGKTRVQIGKELGATEEAVNSYIDKE